jgi:hypothetical protein
MGDSEPPAGPGFEEACKGCRKKLRVPELSAAIGSYAVGRRLIEDRFRPSNEVMANEVMANS